MAVKARGKDGVAHRQERRFLQRIQQVQDFLSDLVKVNLSLFDSQGNYLTVPSKATEFCSDFVQYANEQRHTNIRCVAKALGRFLHDHKKIYTCIHDLKYACILMGARHKASMVLVLGPFLLGHRESKETYQKFCTTAGIDYESFYDRVQELPVFSHDSLETVMNLAHSVMKDPCQSCELYLLHTKD